VRVKYNIQRIAQRKELILKALREGFEPARDLRLTSSQGWRRRPLGYLSMKRYASA
jgi:hypothetical protein